MKYAICIHQQNSVDRVIMDIVDENDIRTFIEIMMIRWRGKLTPHHYNNIAKCAAELLDKHSADIYLGYHHYHIQIIPTVAQKYYKAVDNKLCSAVVMHKHEVQYKLNEFVQSGNSSKLFVFDNLETARQFAFGWREPNSETQYHLYECEVINPVKSPTLVLEPFCHAFNENNYDKYWYNYEYHRDNIMKGIESIDLRVAPTNTVLCDAVKLTRRIS